MRSNTVSPKSKVRILDMRDKGKGVLAIVEVRRNRHEFKGETERDAILGLRIDLDFKGVKEEEIFWEEWEKYL